ncbi:hypothetical protein [Parasediminibacterium sp. JCM 36343]|uniref:hypothetical protein n=1 Tax=Parasediminibacterium sp. JCM 36343 TaxID=3374279 RepID=UPI00397D202C
MKKVFFWVLLLYSVGIVLWSCSKNSVSNPSVCFTISALDSAKVSMLDKLTVDSIMKNHTAGYFIDMQDGVPANVYKKTLYFNYCGSGSDFRVIYTGDSAHTHIDSSNINSITDTETAFDFSSNYVIHQYTKAGTYKVVAIATNVGNNAKSTGRGEASKSVIIK